MIAAYYLGCVAAVLWIACDDDVPDWAIAVPAVLVLIPAAVFLLAAAPFPDRTSRSAGRGQLRFGRTGAQQLIESSERVASDLA